MSVEDQDHVSRAERERERYNQGLDDRYRRFLMRSMHHFERFRIETGAEVIKSFETPRVLELGSYAWHKYVERGECEVGELICINISEAEMEKGRWLATRSRATPEFRLMDAQALEFEDDSFDVVFGAAILHHLDMDRALAEIQRVLKPDGRMFFVEPMDMNPVGRVVRALTPAARTEDERPFRMRDLRMLEERFDCRFDFTEFLTVPVGALATLLGVSGDSGLMGAVYRIDRAIGRIPGLRTWCRNVMVVGRPKAAA
mgnify:CR=1 FL=1